VLSVTESKYAHILHEIQYAMSPAAMLYFVFRHELFAIAALLFGICVYFVYAQATEVGDSLLDRDRRRRRANESWRLKTYGEGAELAQSAMGGYGTVDGATIGGLPESVHHQLPA